VPPARALPGAEDDHPAAMEGAPPVVPAYGARPEQPRMVPPRSER